MTNRIVAAVAGAVVACVVSYYAWNSVRAHGTVRSVPRNVVLITVDTLRADHLGAYGYNRQTSPNIDRFAERSQLFWNAYCLVPKTSGSVATIMTGLHPFVHQTDSIKSPLDLKHRTLAEKFAARGWDTLAIVDNPNLSAHFNFDQGFDTYIQVWRRVKTKEESADFITRRAIEFLRASRSSPFFLWLHYIDPHAPYEPPPDLVRFDPAEAGREPARLQHAELMGTEHERRLARKEGRPEGYFVALYDAEIRRVDACIGRVLDEIHSRPAEDSIVVFTADHGEELGEHNMFWDHGPLCYESSTRVPLAVEIPGEAHRVIREPVCLADIYPTLVGEAARAEGAGIPLDQAIPPREILIWGTHSHAVLSSGRLLTRMDDIQLAKKLRLPITECFDISVSGSKRYVPTNMPEDVASDIEKRFVMFHETHPYPLHRRARDSSIPAEDLREIKALGYMN